MKFKVGDRVRVVYPDSLAHGQETMVLQIGVFANPCEEPWAAYMGSEVDIPCFHSRFAFCIFKDCNLEPIYDGHEKTTWDTCEFKPTELVT